MGHRRRKHMLLKDYVAVRSMLMLGNFKSIGAVRSLKNSYFLCCKRKFAKTCEHKTFLGFPFHEKGTLLLRLWSHPFISFFFNVCLEIELTLCKFWFSITEKIRNEKSQITPNLHRKASIEHNFAVLSSISLFNKILPWKMFGGK